MYSAGEPPCASEAGFSKVTDEECFPELLMVQRRIASLMFNIRLLQRQYVCKYLVVARQSGTVLVGGLDGT